MEAPGTPAPGTPTPDPGREARIAELAARRRARMRTLARRSALLAAAVCGLLVLAVWWLLNTIAAPSHTTGTPRERSTLATASAGKM